VSLYTCAVIEMEIQAGKEEAMARIAEVAGIDVRTAIELDEGWLRLEIEADSSIMRVELFNLAVTEGWALRELTEQEHSLEDTFVHITRNPEAMQ
jgi:hypothetical protein